MLWRSGSAAYFRLDRPTSAAEQLAQARQSLAENALAITEAIPVGTYTMVLPPEGGMASFGFMSDRFLQICGLEREEAAADPFKAFACIHPDDYDDWVKLNAETFATKQPFIGECRVIVEGEVRWVRAESVPRDLGDGSTVWEGVLIDITAQQQALQQLEEERSLLKTVLGHIDAQVYMKDRQGRYLYANASAEKLIPHATSLVGLTDADLMPADAAQAIRDMDEQVFREGGPIWREERLPIPGSAERIFLSEKLLFRQPGQDDCLIGFSTEITQLRKATEQLAASEEQFRLLAQNSSDVVFRVDQSGHIVWVSPSLTAALGWLPDDWIGQVGTKFLLHGGQAEQYQSNVEALKTGGTSVIAREQIFAKDGSLHWVETHAGPYVNGKGVVDGIVASFRLIDAVVAAEQELRQRASTDELTGLLNRRELLAQLESLLEQSDRRRSGERLGLLFCDLDLFKEINDSLGHAAGDLVLCSVADRIRSAVRNDDLVGRMGGDEMVVVLRSVADLDAAVTIAEAIAAAICEPINGSQRQIVITASIGVTLARPTEDVDALMSRADVAMYAAKQAGRAQVIRLD